MIKVVMNQILQLVLVSDFVDCIMMKWYHGYLGKDLLTSSDTNDAKYNNTYSSYIIDCKGIDNVHKVLIAIGQSGSTGRAFDTVTTTSIAKEPHANSCNNVQYQKKCMQMKYQLVIYGGNKGTRIFQVAEFYTCNRIVCAFHCFR